MYSLHPWGPCLSNCPGVISLGTCARCTFYPAYRAVLQLSSTIFLSTCPCVQRRGVSELCTCCQSEAGISLSCDQRADFSRRGSSSVGRATDWHAADADSIPWCGKGFFSHSQLSVQTLFRCLYTPCLLYTSPSPRDAAQSRMPSSA